MILSKFEFNGFVRYAVMPFKQTEVVVIRPLDGVVDTHVFEDIYPMMDFPLVEGRRMVFEYRGHDETILTGDWRVMRIPIYELKTVI